MNPIEMTPLAAIDAGSNAIRLLVAQARSATGFAVVEAERVPVRLGHHTFTSGELDRETIERAVAAFARFRKIFDQHGVTRYRAVATSALRNATNREDLLDRVYRDAGIELEVIDGEEEARLMRKAVLRAFADREPPRIIVDLGGGSLEITADHGGDWSTSSMKIGTVRLLEVFGLGGSISDDEARMIRRFVSSALSQSLARDRLPREVATAAACGGNAEALASLFGRPDKQGCPALKRSALESALPAILGADEEARIDRFGVRRDRAEVMGVAALVFATVAEHLQLERLLVPGVGIREGVLLELAEATVGELAPAGESALVAGARTFAARIGHNTSHGEQVRRLCVALFRQLGDLHELKEESGLVLELAALLHDIGEVVHRKGHHRHSEYLILNGRIPGLEGSLRERVAAVARAHRKAPPSARKHHTYSELAPKTQSEVRRLAALLRVADELDNDHRQRIVALSAETETDSDRVTLHVSVACDGTLPAAGALRKADGFEEEFGRRLVYTVSEVAAAPRPPLRRE